MIRSYFEELTEGTTVPHYRCSMRQDAYGVMAIEWVKE
jgi:hypothetical protein